MKRYVPCCIIEAASFDMPNPKTFLLSFADSSLSRTSARISKQAKAMNCFDDIRVLNEADLSHPFRRQFCEILNKSTRGFGYWIWKPHIILQMMCDINKNDRLIYLDAGFHINKRGRWRLEEYLNLADSSDHGLIVFQADKPTTINSRLHYDGRSLFDQPNKAWIKGDTFDYFGARHNSKYTESQAIGAGLIIIRNCSKSLRLIREWADIMQSHFNLVNDSPSSSPNLDGFIENRHDQSIFTMLCIKYNLFTLSAYEYWYPNTNTTKGFIPDWAALVDFPFHAKRDKA